MASLIHPKVLYMECVLYIECVLYVCREYVLYKECVLYVDCVLGYVFVSDRMCSLSLFLICFFLKSQCPSKGMTRRLCC